MEPQDGPGKDFPSKVAFISGHIDLTRDAFLQHYQAALDTAIARGDRFILSNAGGADSLGVEYLISNGVSPNRITIYIHTPPAKRQKYANDTMRRIDELRTGEDTLNRYRGQGLGVQVVNGWHTEGDAAMTAASDYDILYVRPHEETRLLYGAKYRPERISGTEKNRRRREQVGSENRTQ